MPHEWLLIALPLVFVLGWFAARLDIYHIRHNAAKLPRAYLRGLTELLNGNEDKALDAFSDIGQKENLPPALQFTVGELSRRRGDYRRALKVHQQLQENEKLSEAERNRALWEMTNDCAAMGFVDAAEQHARLLANTSGYRYKVFDFLLKNYQSRRRYRQALQLINSAEHNAQQLQQKTAAHLYCQLALADDSGQTALLKQALEINPFCARARLQLAELALAETPPQTRQALEYYNQIAADTPQYLWLTAAGIWRAGEITGDTAPAQRQLLRWLQEFPSPMLFKTAVALLEEQSQHEGGETQQQLRRSIHALIEEFMTRHGGIEAAAYFVHHQAGGEQTAQWLAVEKALLNACLKAFICTHCSYEINYFDWQCPCCLNWESFEQRKQ